jgi:hypothetical protein
MRDGGQLACTLSRMKGLRKLKLTHSSVSDADASSLILELERLPLLNHIDLSFCQLEAAITKRLAVCFSLSARATVYVERCIQECVHACMSSKAIECLEVHHCGMWLLIGYHIVHNLNPVH